MSEIVRLNTNIPETIALRFLSGKEVEGRFGPQVMYSLVGGKVIYLPPAAAQKISELGVGPNEPFEICKAEVKNGARATTEYRVNRVAEEDAPAAGLAPQPAMVDAPAASRRVATERKNGKAIGTGVDPAPPATQISGNHTASPGFDPKAEMIRCYQTAVDVAIAAEQYASEHNYSLRFASEDIRQIAATLYIDRGKDRRTGCLLPRAVPTNGRRYQATDDDLPPILQGPAPKPPQKAAALIEEAELEAYGV